MPRHGFNIVNRRQWGARPARSRATRPASTVNTLYLHWPGHPGNLRTADLEQALLVPEEEASDCLLTPELLEQLDAINRRAVTGRIDTAAEERAFMRQIQRFHMDTRRWQDFAYNYAMFLSGRVYAGRTYRVIPASQAPFNTTGVSLCVMLGTGDTISRAVREQLPDFVRWAERYARHDLRVRGHRDVNQTTCPGPRLADLALKLSRL